MDDEPVEWLPGGTPFSPRYGDRYHSESGEPLDQANTVFLAGCGLPAAWAHRASWTVLETGFGFGLNFLATLAAWRRDPDRPARLNFVSVEAHPVGVADLSRRLAGLAVDAADRETLLAQWWGLDAGVHRLAFAGGAVTLLLAIGEASRVLADVVTRADAVFLDGFGPSRNPGMWNRDTLRSVARHCGPGTSLATWCVAGEVRESLKALGFEVARAEGLPPKRHRLEARFAPAWTSKAPIDPAFVARPADRAPECVVVGAGLAGAAVADRFAARDWRVTVIERGTAPAAGASGLPVGLFVPHWTADDAPSSRITRAGIRIMAGRARALLGQDDWAMTGCVERLEREAIRRGPEAWGGPATEEALARAGAGSGPAHHHRIAGWLRPARLVDAFLQASGARIVTGEAIASIRYERDTARTNVLDAGGRLVASGDCVVVAAGASSDRLFEPPLGLAALSGEMAHGAALGGTDGLPVNGDGHFIPRASSDSGPAWACGSSYVRGEPTPDALGAARGAWLDRVRALASDADRALASGEARYWSGTRATYRDHLPLVGPVPRDDGGRVLVATAMGSRGISLALLAAELLAARVSGEPLPVSRGDARRLDVARALPAIPAPSPRRA